MQRSLASFCFKWGRQCQGYFLLPAERGEGKEEVTHVFFLGASEEQKFARREIGGGNGGEEEREEQSMRRGLAGYLEPPGLEDLRAEKHRIEMG